MSSSGTNASAPLPLKQRPGMAENLAPGGRASAPPGGQHQQRPTAAAGPSPGPGKLSPAPPGAGAGRPVGGGAGGKVQQQQPQRPDGKQGPATFEEMGIPQGKNEGDCVSFFLSSSFFLGWWLILFDRL